MARRVKRLYTRAKALAAVGCPPVRGYQRLTSPDQLMLEEQLLSLCRPFMDDETAPQAKLCRRIERFIKELFVFVSHPDAPPDNNAAERPETPGGQPQDQRRRSLRTDTDSRMTLASLNPGWLV